MKKRLQLKPLTGVLITSAFAVLGIQAQDENLTELEAFIQEETGDSLSSSLLPTDRTLDSVFLGDMGLLDTPRAITVLSPETMEEFDIQDFSDLQKIGAGTEQVNFYGVPGTPSIRGWKGGTFFNGMLRAFQRNEMPTSFGSLEALEVVKGMAPAQYLSSQVGGYVNMVPKSPFFDEMRGEVKLKIGSYDYFNLQVDVGAPVLLFDETPAAYRVSITTQQADKYYDRIGNDFISIYGSMKVKVSDKLRLFFGGEYFDYNSNENAGWNRPTQNLIDTGSYVVGEPLSLVRLGNGGVADRNLINETVWAFGSLDGSTPQGAAFRALVVPDSYITNALANGTLTASQVALMSDLSDDAVRAGLYAGLPTDMAQTNSGFLYTPDYFLGPDGTAGTTDDGIVFTEQISGNQVLSDDADYAKSNDILLFFDAEFKPSSDLTIKNKVFFERLKTDKLSSYGYSLRSEQTVFDDRLEIHGEADLGFAILDYLAGAELRYTDALQLQDFWVEPFARRDISTGVVSANSVILSGAQTDPLIGGNNYWGDGYGASGPGGHAVQSELLQLGAFALGNIKFSETISVILSARQEFADWDVSVPEQASDIAPASSSGSTDYFNWSINPNLNFGSFSLYGVYQEGSTYSPLQGGPIISEANFGDSKLQEIGAKFSLIEGKLYASLAYYEWEQSSVNNFSSNSEQFESEGIEFELTWAATEDLTVIASYGNRETRKIGGLGFRTMPWNLLDPTGLGNPEVGLALESGSLANQFSAAFGGFTPEGGTPTNNPDLIMPGVPETTMKLYAVYDLPKGFKIGGGVVYQESFWANYDRTLKLPSALIASANIGWEGETWALNLAVENLTNEDYFFGADPEFAANTIITKAPERSFSVTAKYKF